MQASGPEGFTLLETFSNWISWVGPFFLADPLHGWTIPVTCFTQPQSSTYKWVNDYRVNFV